MALPVQPGGSRTATKTAAGGGASRPSSSATSGHDMNVGGTQFTKKPTPGVGTSSKPAAGSGHDMDVGGTQFAGILDMQNIKGPWIANDNPNPVQAPYVLPGLRASRQTNTYLNGTIMAQQAPTAALGRRTNWGFRFHYNPPEITESVQTNYSQVPDENDIGTVLGTGLGTMTFQFLINRQEDVAAHRALHVPMLGKKNFYDLGTLYDIEFLYRTINGDPQPTSIIKDSTKNGKPDPNGSANLGFLYMTSVEIRFNNIRFVGFINSLTFEHKMFSSKMVPTLTYCTIVATRFLSGSALPGPNASTAGTDLAPKATPPKPKPKTPTPKPGPAPTPRPS